MNTPGYASPQADELIRRLSETGDLAEAARLAAELDDLLAADLPYLVLYSPVVAEAYRREVSFPVTRLAGGLQAAGGFPSLVRIEGVTG